MGRGSSFDCFKRVIPSRRTLRLTGLLGGGPTSSREMGKFFKRELTLVNSYFYSPASSTGGGIEESEVERL